MFGFALLCAALGMTGCGSFSGTRHESPWAQEYNYLKGQRLEPEEIGIITSNVGPYTLVFTSAGVAGDERTTVPLSLRGGAIMTPVVVNGTREVPAVIDTGAPFNLVSLTLAYNLNLPVTRPKSLPQVIGGYGGASTECGWSLLKSVKMGGSTYTNSLVSIPLEKFEQVTFFGFLTMNRDEFIIFGLNDLMKLSYATFDFQRKQFVMAQRAEFQPGDGTNRIEVPIRIQPGPVLGCEVRVEGKGPFPCRLDTGKTFNAPALTIPQKLAEELGYWERDGARRTSQVGIGGKFESQRFRLKNFEIGGRSFSNLPADTHEGAGELILGASFLRDYKVTLDFRTGKMHLEK